MHIYNIIHVISILIEYFYKKFTKTDYINLIYKNTETKTNSN